MIYEKIRDNVAETLSYIDLTKPYGTKLFDALARVTISVAVEACALRKSSKTDEIEVFWRRRSMDDTAYPGEWHFPGSVMRPGETVEDVLRRLEKREFGTSILSFDFVANLNNINEERGHFFTPVYLLELADNAASSDTKGWFSITNLPIPVVGFHLNDLLPLVTKAFLNKK